MVLSEDGDESMPGKLGVVTIAQCLSGIISPSEETCMEGSHVNSRELRCQL